MSKRQWAEASAISSSCVRPFGNQHVAPSRRCGATSPKRSGRAASARALTASAMMTYLTAAHQAIRGTGDAASRRAGVRAAASAFSWGDVAVTLRERPPVGAAGLLLKAAPGLYGRLYRAYVARAYNVGR